MQKGSDPDCVIYGLGPRPAPRSMKYNQTNSVLPERALGVEGAVAKSYNLKLSVNPMGTFSFLLSMRPGPRLFTEVTYEGQCNLRCDSVKGHCRSNKPWIDMVNTIRVLLKCNAHTGLYSWIISATSNSYILNEPKGWMGCLG